jgi:hypothetical protein
MRGGQRSCGQGKFRYLATTTPRATEGQLVHKVGAGRVVAVRVHLGLFGPRFVKMSSPRFDFFRSIVRVYARGRARDLYTTRVLFGKKRNAGIVSLHLAISCSQGHSIGVTISSTLDMRIARMQYQKHPLLDGEAST